MTTVAVYGSLRKGMGNHNLIAGGELLGFGSVKGTLYANGGFPILSLEGDTDVKVEVYEVSDRILNNLDWLEGYVDDQQHWYNRTKVDVGLCEAYIYHQTKEHNLPVVESGDWTNFYTQP